MAGLQYREAVIGQNLPEQFPDSVFIFDHQHRFVAPQRAGGVGRDLGLDLEPRDEDLDRSSLLRLTGDPNHAAVLFDYSIDNGEAEAGAARGQPGGEERIEDMRQRVAIHPRTGVAHREDEVPPGFHRPAPGRSADLPLACLDGQAAAGRHGVPRVQHQIHQDLFQLGRIHLDFAQARPQPGPQPDVGSDQSLEQAFHAADHRVELQRAGLKRRRLSEGQQLPGELSAAIRRFPDLLYVLAAGMVLREIAQQEVAESANGGKQVVEIMRHAAGQPARRVHPLGLAQLLLALVQRRPGTGALGDVGSQHQTGAAPGDFHFVGHQLHVDNGSILPLVLSQRHFAAVDAAALQSVVQTGSVFRRQNVHDGHAQKLVAGIAILADRGVVHVEETQRLRIEDPHRLRVAREQHPVPLVGLMSGAVQPGVVHREGSSARQLLREGKVVHLVAPSRFRRHHQSDRADALSPGHERDPDERGRAQGPKQLELLGVLGVYAQDFVGGFSHGRDPVGDPERRAGGPVLAQGADQEILGGIAVRPGDELQAALLARHVDGAPIGQGGDDQPGEISQGAACSRATRPASRWRRRRRPGGAPPVPPRPARAG